MSKTVGKLLFVDICPHNTGLSLNLKAIFGEICERTDSRSVRECDDSKEKPNCIKRSDVISIRESVSTEFEIKKEIVQCQCVFVARRETSDI